MLFVVYTCAFSSLLKTCCVHTSFPQVCRAIYKVCSASRGTWSTRARSYIAHTYTHASLRKKKKIARMAHPLTELVARDVRPAMQLIYGLRECGVEKDIDIPQVAVIGDQSSGKVCCSLCYVCDIVKRMLTKSTSSHVLIVCVLYSSMLYTYILSALPQRLVQRP